METNISVAGNAISTQSARINYMIEMILVELSGVDEKCNEEMHKALAELNGIGTSSIYY